MFHQRIHVIDIDLICGPCTFIYTCDMGVSKNRVFLPPKSSISSFRFSIINYIPSSLGGFPPIFGLTPTCVSNGFFVVYLKFSTQIPCDEFIPPKDVPFLRAWPMFEGVERVQFCLRS